MSWRTIGHAFGLGRQPGFVRDCMEGTTSIVNEDDSIFRLIELVTANEVALVQAQDRRYVTIFTAADLSGLYQDLSEAFIYLGEIEDCIRGLIERGRFTPEELAGYRGPDDAEEVSRMDDLTFGSYMRIVQRPENWDRLGLTIDRTCFVQELDEIRIIRNAVMHFDPDGLTGEQIGQLKNFWKFLRLLRQTAPATA